MFEFLYQIFVLAESKGNESPAEQAPDMGTPINTVEDETKGEVDQNDSKNSTPFNTNASADYN